MVHGSSHASIYEKIGRGKHSTVYKGRKKKSIQYYAIKSVEKTQKNRVLQEVRTMHALDNKNILKFFNWYETTNHLWLILEYCVGGDLMSLLRQDCKLPESSVHDFGRDLVVALQYLHSNSIIYCDLKPSNTLLDENGRLKLGGFGLSRRLSEINKKPLTTLPQAMRGTPCYMAPELYSEGSTHSTASDLWSLGCVLYECTVGAPPFMNTSFNVLMQQILNEEPPPVPGASPEFQELLVRLLDKNPATRINWQDLVTHPFWKVRLPTREMPAEPALDAFIARYGLRPSVEEIRQSVTSLKPLDKSRIMRQSINVVRLSRIAQSNLDKEGDGSDYTTAEARGSDIRIETADAELDFEEVKEEVTDDEAMPSPAQSEDGSAIDQATSSSNLRLSDNGGKVVGALTADAMKAETCGGGGPTRGAELPSRAAEHDQQGMASSRAALPGAGAAAQQAELADDDDMERGMSSSQLVGAGADAAAMERLIWTAADTAVKPIVANKRIERTPEPRFDAKSLPFEPLTMEVGRTACLLVRHATYISDALSRSSIVEVLSEALKDKNERVRRRVMATLGELLFYIATQQQDAAGGGGGGGGTSANAVAEAWGITSSTISLVARCVCGTAGWVWDSWVGVGQLGGCGTAGWVWDSRVCVGQPGGCGTAGWVWDSRVGVGQPGGCGTAGLLKPQEDEIAQHYAVKTVENICSQGGDWASKFANTDVAFNLIQIYNSGRGENLKATTASTLSRLLRHSPQLVAYVVDKFGVRLFVSGLSDPSAKVQVAALNMLNLALSQPDLTVRARAALSDVSRHSWLSTRWLLETCKAKLIPLIEKLVREKDEYLTEVIGALRGEMTRLVPAICQQVMDRINEELLTLSGRKLVSSSSPIRASTSAGPKNPLLQFQVVLHFITSPYFRASTVTPALLTDVAAYLTRGRWRRQQRHAGLQEYGGARAGSGGAARAPHHVPRSRPDGMPLHSGILPSLTRACGSTTRRSCLQLATSTSSVQVPASPPPAPCGPLYAQQAELVLLHHDTFLHTLLPTLCDVVASPSESGDRRFFCLRMLSDVLSLYLSDEELYGRPATGLAASFGGPQAGGGRAGKGNGDSSDAGGSGCGVATEAVDALLRTHVLPLLPHLLEDEEPMPLYALKLLGGVLEADPPAMWPTNNNVHNLRLCRQIIASGSMGVAQLLELGVGEQVAAVFEYATSNAVEPFLEPVLELCHAIIARDMGEVAAGTSTGALMAVLLDQAPLFLDCASHPDSAVSLAAAGCLADLVASFPPQAAPWLLSPDSVALLVPMLTGEHLLQQTNPTGHPSSIQQQQQQQQQQVLQPSPQLQQLLLEAVAHSLEVEGAVNGPSPQLLQLYEVARHLSVAGDVGSRALAGEVAQALEPLLEG
ncbi:MAG: hypothetical protein WDW38_002255 [Sanguina aurantia]